MKIVRQMVIPGVDVWRRFIQGDDPTVQRMDEMVAEECLLIPEAVAAGALLNGEDPETLAVFREFVVDNPAADSGRAPWMRAGELAWRLNQEGKGKISLIDAHTALTAHRAKAAVWTREASLRAVADFLGLKVLSS